MPQGVPYQGLVRAFVFVPVYVAGSGDGLPIDFRMTLLEFVWSSR